MIVLNLWNLSVRVLGLFSACKSSKLKKFHDQIGESRIYNFYEGRYLYKMRHLKISNHKHWWVIFAFCARLDSWTQGQSKYILYIYVNSVLSSLIYFSPGATRQCFHFPTGPKPSLLLNATSPVRTRTKLPYIPLSGLWCLSLSYRP